MGPLVFIAVLLVAGSVAVASFVLKQRRREATVAFGLQYNLVYSRDDPTGLLSLDFRLFRAGDGRGIENVLSGDWQGLRVWEADYWYYTESTDSKGHRSKSYHRFSVVVTDLELFVPRVSIERENLMTRLADALSFHDLDFESEAFNREFQVKGSDREFAYKLIDARMMQWLLSTEGRFGFELSGPALLVWCQRRRPTELVPVLGSAKMFRDHIPQLVRDEYSTREPVRPDEERRTP